MSVALTDASGNIVASYSYDEFGNLQPGSTENFPNGWTNPYRYDGAEGVLYDPETGLYWMSVRAYDPTLGRYISHDPLGRLAAMGMDMQPYVYVSNNPVNRTDPSGMLPGRMKDTGDGGNPPAPTNPSPPPATSQRDRCRHNPDACQSGGGNGKKGGLAVQKPNDAPPPNAQQIAMAMAISGTAANVFGEIAVILGVLATMAGVYGFMYGNMAVRDGTAAMEATSEGNAPEAASDANNFLTNIQISQLAYTASWLLYLMAAEAGAMAYVFGKQASSQVWTHDALQNGWASAAIASISIAFSGFYATLALLCGKLSSTFLGKSAFVAGLIGQVSNFAFFGTAELFLTMENSAIGG